MSDQDHSQFGPAMEALGINPSELDASDLELGESEAIMDEGTEVVEGDAALEDDEGSEDQADAPKGEEKATQEEAPVTEEATEEKTAKEIQEIEALKAALDAEKSSFMEERQKIETEFVQQYAEKLKAHDEFDAFLTTLASKDPELFSLLQDEYKEHAKAYSNPVLDQFKKQQEEMARSLSEIKQRFSDEATRIKYDAELNQVKSTVGKEAESLGVKADWKLVEEVWKDNPKLSLEEAFHAKYGPSMAKAAASKAKVEAVEKKVQSRPVVSTSGTVQRSNSRPSTVVPTDAFDAVRHFARQFAGKN
jgi:succinate dehydrogenase flavin-adding protein (antitoxin of CptAB toxin-antitoxin module)